MIHSHASMKTIYIRLTLASLLAGIAPAIAQEGNKSIIEQEQEIQYLQWDKTNNAAGLLLDQPKEHSSLSLGYGQTDGNFRRPQTGKCQTDIDLYTRGNTYLKKAYIQGYFSYNRNDIKAAEYNTTLIDPFRGMPYMLADTNASNWQNQHYAFGFKASSRQLGEHWYLGLAAHYKASSGAKQRDIRTNNKYYQLDVLPAVTYAVNAQHAIGANFLYKNYKEEANNSNFTSNVDQGYFALFGLGNSFNYVGAGRTYNYLGDALGGGLQYQYQGAIKVLLFANYRVKAEDANISFSNSRPGGSTLEKRWDGGLQLQREGAIFLHGLQADFSDGKTNGIEYINEFVSGTESDGYYTRYQSVRSTYHRQQLAARYEILQKQGDAYNWKAAALLSYDQLHDTYLIPESNMEVSNISYGLEASKLFSLSSIRKSQLAIGLKAQIKKNDKASFVYNGSDANSLTVTDLEERNFQFYKADFQQYELPITYAQQLNNQSNVQLFFKAAGRFTKTDSYTFKDRKSCHFSIGATF